MLPGPPLECGPLLQYRVRPLLEARSDSLILSHSVKIFGIGEGTMEYRLRDLMNEMTNPTLAPYAKEGECLVRVTAKAKTAGEAEAMIAPWVERVQRELGEFAYGVDTPNIQTCAMELLMQQGKTIAVAESCTGGLIAQRITSVPGSSEVFGYGFVTYWEAAKARLVGVEPDVIAKYNVVSAPVAAQMALGAAQAAGAEIGISVTGVAGPTGGDALRPVGTVYLGAACGETVYVKKLFVSRPDRALVRARAAQAALELALRLAQGKVPADTQALAKSARHDAAALTALDSTFLKG